MVLSMGMATAEAGSDDRIILNQKSLSFGVDEITRLLGPGEQSLALRRIVGIDQSLALTRVRHNNRLVLLNPHRMLFDELGFVDTGEFLATTLRIHGSHEGSHGPQAVVSASTVYVSEHGYIALTTPGVTSEAVVIAAVSTFPSDAQRKIVFDFMSDGLVQYAIGESELDQLTGVDGKALAKASSDQRAEAVGGHMLVNARSAADIQRSVMNTENVPRARHLVMENGLIRLKGESSLQAMTRPPRNPISSDHHASEPASTTITASVIPISPTSIQEAASVSGHRTDRRDGASLRPNQADGRKPALAKKQSPTDSRLQKAKRAEGKSVPKGKTKPQKASPLSRADQVQSTPWSSIPKGLPEWMKYLPKTESTENPAIP